MSRLTRDGTSEPVSRNQILRHVRGQRNIHFPCSADHEQDWHPYPVDPYSATCDDHTYVPTKKNYTQVTTPIRADSHADTLEMSTVLSVLPRRVSNSSYGLVLEGPWTKLGR